MKLIGKCRKEFENYLEAKMPPYIKSIDIDMSFNFYRYPESMQYGVYVDFFDNVGIEIYNLKTISELLDKNNKKCYYIEELKSRAESRTAAIKKANELRNQQLNK
jgi:hypothetical protein